MVREMPFRRRISLLTLCAIAALAVSSPGSSSPGSGASDGDLAGLLPGSVSTAQTAIPTGPRTPAAVVAPQPSEAQLVVGKNVNVIGKYDAIETRSASCNVGKQ